MTDRALHLSRWVTCAVVVLAGLLLTSAVVLGGSAGGTLPTGRSVTAQSDSWRLSSRFTHDTATIETSGRKIVVAPTAVLLDGRPLATLDAAAKSVDVRVKKKTITIVADGKMVVTHSW